MVRVVFWSILALILSNGVTAQKNLWGFQLRPGIADSQSNTEEQSFGDRIDPRLTIGIGGQYLRRLSDSSRDNSLFFETGIYFIDRGNIQRDFTWDLGGGKEVKTDIALHSFHIAVPLLLKWDFDRIYTSFGPTVEYYLGSYYSYSSDSIESDFIRFTTNYWKLGLDLNVGWSQSLTSSTRFYVESSFSPQCFYYNSKFNNWDVFLLYEMNVGLLFGS